MRTSVLFCLLLFFAWGTAQAQFITHGPIIGAVAPNTARVYLRTHTAQAFELEYSTDPNFGTLQTLSAATEANRDSATVLNLSGLNPNTEYFMRFRFGGTLDSITGSFRTFPTPGDRQPFTLATGSCQETENMNVFREIPNHDPLLFIHLGDWTYPSYQLPDDRYPEDWEYVALSYRRRYEEVNMREMLHHLPVDYVYDDDDFTEGGSVRDFYTRVEQVDDNGTNRNLIINTPVPDSVRKNCIAGYTTFFPHYPLVDTAEGIFHSYRVGNAEVFFCDIRGTQTPLDGALAYDTLNNEWRWEPQPGHTLLRQAQFEWLKQGLLNSDADWKIIATGAVFNRGYRSFIRAGLDWQNTTIGDFNGFQLVAGFTGEWAGYPESDSLMAFLEANEITDVVAISGQSHVNMVDDGTNAGIPELNASGLSVAENDKLLMSGLQLLPGFLGFPSVLDSLWNGGGTGIGQGVGNQNNGFGKLEFFGNDSLRLSVIDENGAVMGEVMLLHSSKVVTRPEEQLAEQQVLKVVYPSPATDVVRIQFQKGYQPATEDRIRVSNLAGQTLLEIPITPHRNTGLQQIDVSQWPAGVYQLGFITRHGFYNRKIVVE